MPEKKKTKKTVARRRLVDVECQSLDLVDSPAINKKFLVVKRHDDDKGFKVEKQDEPNAEANDTSSTDSDTAHDAASDPRVAAVSELEKLVTEGEEKPLSDPDKTAMRSALERIGAVVAVGSQENAGDASGEGSEKPPEDKGQAAEATTDEPPPPKAESPEGDGKAKGEDKPPAVEEEPIDDAEATAFFDAQVEREVGALLVGGKS